MDPVRIGSSLPPLVESEAAFSAVENKPQELLKPAVSSASTPTNEGQVFQPSVGDEVLVSFEHGDMRQPYVLGGLWNGGTPPTDAGSPTGHDDNRLSEERAKLLEHQLKNLK